MLVLARKRNETIVVGGEIEITVLKIQGNTVRLGIKAPSDVKVLRGELSPFQIDLMPTAICEPESDPISHNPVAQAS